MVKNKKRIIYKPRFTKIIFSLDGLIIDNNQPIYSSMSKRWTNYGAS